MVSYNKAQVSIALLLSLNLLFFTMVCSKSQQPHRRSQPRCPISRKRLAANCRTTVSPQLQPTNNCCKLIKRLNRKNARSCLCKLASSVLGIDQLNFAMDTAQTNVLLISCKRSDLVGTFTCF
ncbi:Bifunctional inhibitor/plant lipid transfer protein/seed storage helical domain containing protein [Parasponia andersonii]|uniref:Bifunctional inhibitor/plant lipid transfer protein/seed storage helical domain containing protein n=1 Tax=Parasponia andersonii TaxID=3476 RepID=A0A2P5CMA3_PARAD|nr:Bifunctional inhibitor/plant lipid transfer protein/seed storage helical domain containing protein [Parasponia andersonii]